MSWMDSWSRPNKSSAIPPPLYITDPNALYCRSCGRIISDRKSHNRSASKSNHKGAELAQQANPIKYCSDGCRKRRISPLDRKIARTILAVLDGKSGSGVESIDVKSRMRKGDHRNLISTDEIEQIVFARTEKPKNAVVDQADTDTVDQPNPYQPVDEASAESQGNRPNPSGPGSAEKQREGQKRAEEREAVRRAARRAVVFGFADKESSGPEETLKAENDQFRKCEAVINGQVVEPSYAKGNWYIRWRE